MHARINWLHAAMDLSLENRQVRVLLSDLEKAEDMGHNNLITKVEVQLQQLVKDNLGTKLLNYYK